MSRPPFRHDLYLKGGRRVHEGRMVELERLVTSIEPVLAAEAVPVGATDHLVGLDLTGDLAAIKQRIFKPTR